MSHPEEDDGKTGNGESDMHGFRIFSGRHRNQWVSAAYLFLMMKIADIPRRVELRPLIGVKQTSNVRFLSPKRSCADDVCLRGKSGLSGVTLTTSASSQEATFAGVKILLSEGPESTQIGHSSSLARTSAIDR